MANRISKNSIVISREAVQKKGGLVILPLREYQKLCERVIPAFYLKGKKAEELDKLVEEGLRDYRKEKCKPIRSLADLD
jgi:hypothetical protein